MPESANATAPQKLPSPTHPTRPATRTYSLGELRELTFSTEHEIIGNGLLCQGSIMVVAAPPKNYKSFVTNTIAFQLLIGGHLFGVERVHARTTEHLFPVKPVERVLLIEQEIGLRDTRERLLEFHASLPLSERTILDSHLFVRSCDYDLRFDSALGIQKIRAIVHEVKPSVLILDPLIKFHTSDENSPSEMGRIMLEFRRLIADLGLTIILLHHTGKSEEGKDGLDLLRGASSIAGDIDTGLFLHVTNRNASIIWVDIVLRRGKPIKPFKIRLNHQTLRTEFHGWAKEISDYKSDKLLSEVREVTSAEQ